MSRYLFGSQLLRLNYPRDGDWLSFADVKTKDMTDLQRKQGVRSIPFNRTIIDHFIQGKTQPNDEYKAVHLFQLSNGFREDENYPFSDFNILEHKSLWIDQLKGYMNLPETEERALKGDILPKTFYHILYQYHMIVENVHYISDEAKADVQKIHDLEMPSSYFYELREKILNLY